MIHRRGPPTGKKAGLVAHSHVEGASLQGCAQPKDQVASTIKHVTAEPRGGAYASMVFVEVTPIYECVSAAVKGVIKINFAPDLLANELSHLLGEWRCVRKVLAHTRLARGI
jgi:hypothetical protein